MGERDTIRWYALRGECIVEVPRAETGTKIVHIALDTIDGVTVSTVFLPFDHGFGEGKPVLFETMVFGGAHDQYQLRYTSMKDALDGHAETVKLVKETK